MDTELKNCTVCSAPMALDSTRKTCSTECMNEKRTGPWRTAYLYTQQRAKFARLNSSTGAIRHERETGYGWERFG